MNETSLITIQNEYRVVRCNNCTLVYVNPRPAPAALITLYNDYHQRDDKDDQTWARLMDMNFRSAASFLNRGYPGKGKILDVGCGYGHFVEIMKNCGWVASGIEPSSRTVGYAKSKGLDVAETTIDDAVFPENSFTAITAFYVLEHLFDPFSALRKMHDILKPGGALILRVPHTTPIVKLLNLFNIKNNLYDTPFHLYDFSPKTIRLLLKKAGFSAICVTPGRPTVPERLVESVISLTAGFLSQMLYAASMGKLLFPGTSKTIIAIKTNDKEKEGH